jgi:hypothetical protein
MTPQFLRAEAARFRDMAETVDREASKLRLLAMARDYETRAGGPGAEPDPAVAEPAVAEPAVDEAAAAEPVKVRLGRKLSLERKDPS